MNKVYKHKPLAPDEYLGHVDAGGKVYESRLGPDKYIGRVELESGKIFEARLGPDRYIGNVSKENGKVFLVKLGPDDYLGRVDNHGRLYAHRQLASDEYLGRVAEMTSLIHGGAAFLLLIWPVHEQETSAAKEEEFESESGDARTGHAPAPA